MNSRELLPMLYLGVVVVAPLPFGSNRPLAWSFLAVIVAGILVALAISQFRGRFAPEVPVRWISKIAVFYGLALIWALFQLVPFTPDSFHAPLWGDVGEVLDSTVSSRISVSPYRGWTSFLLLCTYGSVFWLGLQYMRSSTRIRWMLFWLFMAQFAYAAYALIVQFSGSSTILWFDKWAYIGDATGTFVNRNTYATYAGFGMILGVGLLIQEFMQPLKEGYDVRKTVLFIFRRINFRTTVLLLGISVIATALLFTHSRGGVFATTIGLVVLLVATSFARGIHKPRVLFVAGLVLLAGSAIMLFSGDSVIARVGLVDSDIGGRLEFYGLMIQAIGDRPLTGHGHGGFLEVFWQYRTAEIQGYWDKAHNSYLETAVELGLPGLAFLLAANFGMFLLCIRGIRRRRRNQLYPIIGLAVGAIVTVHSLVDFSIQIPAVAVTYAFIMGAACSQSWRSGRTAVEPGRRPTRRRATNLTRLIASSE